LVAPCKPGYPIRFLTSGVNQFNFWPLKIQAEKWMRG